MKIGVIAGTKTDTKLGVAYVRSKGYDAIGRACSKDATLQLDMQLHYPKELANLVISLSKEMIAEGVEGIYVYCNSLSTAIDLDYVRSHVPVKMVTPLDVYAQCASMYKHIFVLVANGQSLAGIERVIKAKNPDSWLSGAALQPLVYAIEDLRPPKEICEELNLWEFLRYFTGMKAEVLILGCTHFPYILDEIRDAVNVPIIDPASQMLQMLIGE